MHTEPIQPGAEPKTESVTDLLSEIADHSTTLVRDEIELAKQEVRETAEGVRGGAIVLLVGVVFIFLSLITFTATLVMWLSYYISPVIAALVTAVALGIIGTITAVTGKNEISKFINRKAEILGVKGESTNA